MIGGVTLQAGYLIAMLEHVVGEEQFAKGLKRYLESFAYSNAIGADVWEVSH